MGIHIIDQNNAVTVIEPFTQKQLRERKVQYWCNVQTQQHNLVYGSSSRKKVASNNEFKIEFSPVTFRNIAKRGNASLKAFAKKTKGNRRVLFSSAHLPMDAAMYKSIYAITHYDGADDLKQFYLYARMLDLLSMQQECYVRAHTEQPVYIKNEYDKERILFARDYLITHLDAPPSLGKLAAIAGINEFKLKCGFKELFKQTVFGYLADLRLEMARTALRQKQKSITQIAFELGYASLQHFSAAFKKKYGVSPRGM
ncbi:MAG: helix-turn-helix transcriptional regulator [Bacteroidia bacterium]